MQQPEADLIRFVLETFAQGIPENLNSRLDTLVSRIQSLEQTHMATMQQFTDAITRVNTVLDKISADVAAQKAEIEALKETVQTLGLTAAQEDTILAALSSIGDKADTIDASVPDPVPVPPAEPPVEEPPVEPPPAEPV